MVAAADTLDERRPRCYFEQCTPYTRIRRPGKRNAAFYYRDPFNGYTSRDDPPPADHQSLLRALLNLARNGGTAMKGARTRLLRIEVTRDPDVVLIRFRDTGPGVANPAALFRPFQPAAGSCFAGIHCLWRMPAKRESPDVTRVRALLVDDHDAVRCRTGDRALRKPRGRDPRPARRRGAAAR